MAPPWPVRAPAAWAVAVAEAPAKPNWDTAHTGDQVGAMLKAEFPYLEVRGFDDRDVDIRSVREFAEAIYDMLTDHPNVALTTGASPNRRPGCRTHTRGVPRPHRQGLPVSGDQPERGPGGRLASVLPSGARRVGHRVGVLRPDKPVYSTIIHEFGHVMDFATHETAHEKQAAHEKTKQVLHEVHRRTAPDVDYDTWVRQQLSAYSFLDPNKEDREVEPSEVHPYEVLAEAFTDATLTATTLARRRRRCINGWSTL